MTRYLCYPTLYCQVPHRRGRPLYPTCQFSPFSPTAKKKAVQISFVFYKMAIEVSAQIKPFFKVKGWAFYPPWSRSTVLGHTKFVTAQRTAPRRRGGPNHPGYGPFTDGRTDEPAANVWVLRRAHTAYTAPGSPTLRRCAPGSGQSPRSRPPTRLPATLPTGRVPVCEAQQGAELVKY